MSNEKGLSAECIACDRAGSHGKHGSASMLMAWRSAPPRSCWKHELEAQLDVFCERAVLCSSEAGTSGCAGLL